MDKKVTSYRLPVVTLEKLEKLLVVVNKSQEETAKQTGLKFSKLTRADLLVHLVDKEFYQYFESNYK